MLVSYYRHCVSIALQRAQVIMIFQWAAALGWGSSSLSHFSGLLHLVGVPHLFHISVGCCTWLGFLISFTHQSQCTSITSWFVINDNFFILGFLCYHWLSFRNYESFLHRVFILFYFCWLFTFVFSLGCVYLCSLLPCTFDEWVPILDFYLHGFFSHLAQSSPFCVHGGV